MGGDTDSGKAAGGKNGQPRQTSREEASRGVPALPGEECRTPPHESWTGAETWAWGEIGAGRIADFNAKEGLEEPLDPNDPGVWEEKREERKLSPAFLETILLHEPWRGAIPRQGVRIVGALFSETIDLSYAGIACQLWLVRCRMESDFLATDVHVDGWLILDGSTARTLSLLRSSIGGLLMMNGSNFRGPVNLDSVHVKGALSMGNKATFDNEVRMIGARIDGQLAMTGATFTGSLLMDSLEVASKLFLNEITIRKSEVNLHGLKVNLCGAKVGGQVNMADSKFEASFIMEHLEVTETLFMPNSKFAGPVSLIYAKVGSIDLSDAEVAELDLTGATIAGELRLDSKLKGRRRWDYASRLVLRNTCIGAIQDGVQGDGANEKTDAWPPELQLEGLSYSRLGGFADRGETADMIRRGSRWFIEWLGRDKTYSPQPYEQLAKVLREAGHTGMAYDILYAGRERARREAAGKKWHGLRLSKWINPKWWGHSLLKWTIGYGLGYRYFWSLAWVTGFTLVGAVVYWWGSGQIPEPDYFQLAWLSFDQLIPIAELNKDHASLVAEGVLNRWALSYFYVHKLIGWLLASFLIAGLAGLTQK